MDIIAARGRKNTAQLPSTRKRPTRVGHGSSPSGLEICSGGFELQNGTADIEVIIRVVAKSKFVHLLQDVAIFLFPEAVDLYSESHVCEPPVEGNVSTIPLVVAPQVDGI